MAVLRSTLSRSLLGILLLMSLLITPAYSVDNQDAQIFISGFNAYQKKDYRQAIEKMSEVLQKYPDSSLYDMAIFWLARANLKAGNTGDAGKYMSQFLRKYPKSPLKASAEPELLKLAADYEKEERMAPAGESKDQVVGTAKSPEAQTPAAPPPPPVVAEKSQGAPAAETPAAPPTAARPSADENIAMTAPPVTGKRAEEKPLPREKGTSKKAAGKKRDKERKEAAAAVAREKAVALYKSVIDRYPGSAAATSATEKLRKLGVVYPPPASAVAAIPEGTKTQVFTLEVGQFADFSFTLGQSSPGYPVGRRISLPFTIVNSGNGADSFSLESGFPADFESRFATAANPDVPVTVTPELPPRGEFKGVLTLTIPRSTVDGQRSTFPVKVTSRYAGDVSQSREVALVASAPLLRGVITADKGKVLPGEAISYRITLLNAGSAEAEGTALRLDYPPQYEPVSGLKQQMKGAMLVDGVRIASGESREFVVTFQVKDDALAHQELYLRGDVSVSEADGRSSFISPVVEVRQISGVVIKAHLDKLTVIPGQVVLVPVSVTNTGNVREGFLVRPEVPAGVTCRLYSDPKRTGVRTASEPEITRLGPLAHREEVHLLMELTTSATAVDGSEAGVSLTLEPESDKSKQASLTVRLRFARPIVELAMQGKGGKIKPGELSSYELTIVNRGSGLARTVALQSLVPPDLEVVGEDPPAAKRENGEVNWTFKELGAGEKRTVRISFKVKAGISVGTNIQIRNALTYEDPLGNRY